MLNSKLNLLTISEVAKILRVHRSTISRILSTGNLKAVEIGSRKLIRESDLLGFIDNHICDRDSGKQTVA